MGLPSRIEYGEIYSYLLREKLGPQYEVEICYFGAMDSQNAIEDRLARDQVAFRRPDIAILHLGINDCAPRVFKRDRLSIIFRDWFPKRIRQVLLQLIHRFRRPLTQYVFRGRVHVPLDRFRRNLIRIRQVIHKYSPSCRFVALSIVPTSSALARRSYGFNTHVATYNSVLRDVFGDAYVDLESLLGGNPETFLISDGIHLTPQSHAAIADHLEARISHIAGKLSQPK
jgi:lysophospholipase L1-like esterase